MLVELSADEICCICFAFGERGIPNKALDAVYAKMLAIAKEIDDPMLDSVDIRVRDRIATAAEPIPLVYFLGEEAASVKKLIRKSVIGVTNDWKVWTLGRPLPKEAAR